MSSETDNMEVQLRAEAMEIRVAITMEMEGSFRCEVGCAISPVNSISKIYLP